MAIPSGTRFGPYTVVAPLGAGGMGEVYRARDERLGRDVALKVLPEGFERDEERLVRFEREARAAGGLNHPALLAVFDLGEQDGRRYLVTELLEGETLRARLARGALPVRRAAAFAAQLAHGLAAAHDKGVTHRDLKPENVFLTADGRAKILDFGLAKVTGEATADDSLSPTQSGMIMGTVGYMAPEQARGKAVDHRADIFALGAIVYEMLSGRRAFGGETPIDRLTAILSRDPAPLAGVVPGLPPALERVVRRCLEKEPGERFQSARDLAFALEAIGDASGDASLAGLPAAQAAGTARSAWRARVAVPAALVVIAAAAAATLLLQRRHDATPALPTFTRVTWERGITGNARFMPDGRSVVYSARWGGDSMQVYVTEGGPRPVPLLPQSASLLAASRQGELAVLLHAQVRGRGYVGTLATVPPGGGQPREIRDNVREACYLPDGQLVMLRHAGGRTHVEGANGQPLFDVPGRHVGLVCSPIASRLLLPCADTTTATNGMIAWVYEPGRALRLVGFRAPRGKCLWASDGRHLWLVHSEDPDQTTLWRLDVETGDAKVVTRFPAHIVLDDCGAGDRLLVERTAFDFEVDALPPGALRPVRLAFRQWMRPLGVSPDGKWAVASDDADTSASGASWLVPTDGGPGRKFENIAAMGVTTDGGTLFAAGDSGVLVLVPVGAGTPRALRARGHFIESATGLPGGRTAFVRLEDPHGCGVLDLATGALRVLPPAMGRNVAGSDGVSPDGARVFSAMDTLTIVVTELADGRTWTAKGLAADEMPIAWTPDSHSLYVYRRRAVPAEIDVLDPVTGARRPWRTISPADPTGLDGLQPVMIARGSGAIVYTQARQQSDLLTIDALR